jgi:asparagine synthase (glutamine-hydrolysing)
MNASVETRYPFLDEDVFAFLARLHPRWKMRGLRDKYILRLLGERYLPTEIAWRRKAMFVAPLDSFLTRTSESGCGYVDQLLSEESLRKTGWFDVARVQLWRDRIRAGRVSLPQRPIAHLGMVGVVASHLLTPSSTALADCRPPRQVTSPRPARLPQALVRDRV